MPSISDGHNPRRRHSDCACFAVERSNKRAMGRGSSPWRDGRRRSEAYSGRRGSRTAGPAPVPAGRKLVADRPQDTARRTHLDRDPAQLRSDGLLTTEMLAAADLAQMEINHLMRRGYPVLLGCEGLSRLHPKVSRYAALLLRHADLHLRDVGQLRSCLFLCFFGSIVCHQHSDLMLDRHRRWKTEFASEPKRIHLRLLCQHPFFTVASTVA
jgi:hypothetical protein